VNPAVTLGLALNGTVKWLDAIVYWVAQFAGALLAAFLMKVFLTPINTDLVNSMATHGAFVTGHQYYAMALEAVLTFLLVNTVLHVTVGGKAGPFAGLVIGLTWTVAIMMGGPLTGASLNPARSFGPAVFTSVITAGTPDFQNPMFYLIFFVGPFLGAVVAVLLYQLFKFEFVSADDLDNEEDEDDDEEVVIEEIVVEEVVEKPVARKSTARKATKK